MDKIKDESEYGLCKCGCGSKTTISKITRNHLGYKRGEASNFVRGHAMRGVTGEKHPLFNGGKSDRKHRAIAEAAFGKKLPEKAQVHHFTKDSFVICEDDKYHKFLHQRTRALKECGHVSWLKCNYCHTYDDPKNLQISPNKRRICHQKCGQEYNKNYRR